MANCRKNIGQYNKRDCAFEAGRVNAFGLVTEEKAVLADADPSLWSNPTFWNDETYTGDIIIFDKVSGGYSASDVTATGKGQQQSRLIGKDHTLTLRIEDVKDNAEFWNDVNISDNYRVTWVGDFYQRLFVGTANALVSANLIEEDDLNTIMEWEVVSLWSDIRVPLNYDPPVGIFN